MTKTLGLAALLCCGAFGATVELPFAGSYTIVDLGPAPGVAANYGGLVIKQGDNNTLLLGGAANGGSGEIDAVGLIRDAGNHITGFTTSSFFSTAPYIDGGLAYAPNGVLLYTAYPTNEIGEIKPGSVAPDKIVASPSVSSLGTLAFIPTGFAGANSFVLGSYSGGGFCTSTLTPDGGGTYDIAGCANTQQTGSGPEGIIYVPLGSPLFTSPSVLITEYSVGRVSAYTIDANGLPDPTTRQDFITGLIGAEGATIDAITGDFLFSTYGGDNHVYAIQGFAPVVSPSVPEPGTVGLFVTGLAGLVAFRRRKA